MQSSDEVANVRFVLGKLTTKLKRVEQSRDVFRRAIEAAVIDTHGCICIYHAALIQSAARWEERALLAQNWLRLHVNELDMTDKLSVSAAIANSSTNRDKCLEKLGLGKAQSADAWADLGAQLAIAADVVVESDEPEAKRKPKGRPNAKPETEPEPEPEPEQEPTND